jgi:hypothetical protein
MLGREPGELLFLLVVLLLGLTGGYGVRAWISRRRRRRSPQRQRVKNGPVNQADHQRSRETLTRLRK